MISRQKYGPQDNPEAKMSPIVTKYLQGLNLTAYTEVSWHNRVDHVGVNFENETIVCIETKIRCYEDAIKQAWKNQHVTYLSFIWALHHPHHKFIDRINKHGLGLIVDGVAIIQPRQTGRQLDWCKQKMLDVCTRIKPGGIGGVRSDNCAIRLLADVEEYRRQHPGTSLDRLFEVVPNHYTCAEQMAGALYLARKRRDGHCWK